MTADGINRKFDMVVVDSVDRCGKYIPVRKMYWLKHSSRRTSLCDSAERFL